MRIRPRSHDKLPPQVTQSITSQVLGDSENQAKAASKDYLGVHAGLKGWRASIKLTRNTLPSDFPVDFKEHKYVTYFLGTFATQEEAAIARDQYIRDNSMNRELNFKTDEEFEHRKRQLDWKWPVIKHREKSSSFRGVSKDGKYWKAGIRHKKADIYLGTFDVEDAAAIAVDQYLIKHGVKRKLNFTRPKLEELKIKLNWQPRSIRLRNNPRNGLSGPLSGLVIPRRRRSTSPTTR